MLIPLLSFSRNGSLCILDNQQRWEMLWEAALEDASHLSRFLEQNLKVISSVPRVNEIQMQGEIKRQINLFQSQDQSYRQKVA